jgi:2-dehydropantoate 2-reductase
MTLRVVVAGAGAVGSVVGGLLAGAGHEVVLVGRAAHMAAIARDGLAVSGLFGDHRVSLETATEVAAVGGARRDPLDFVLVTVKSHGTAAVVRELAAWPVPPRWVVSMQNGLGNVEALEEAFGRERALGARVIFGALLPEAGHAHVTVCARPVAIGPARPDDVAAAAAARLAAAIDASGVPCEAVASVTPLLWEKVLYNCGLNPLGALHGLTYGEVAASDRLRPLLDAAIDEGFEVAQRSGAGLRWDDAASFRAYFHEVLLPPTAAHRSSMRQDLEAGRRTEIDAIGGAILRAGAKVGWPTPINAMLVEQVRAAEAAPDFRSGRRSV